MAFCSTTAFAAWALMVQSAPGPSVDLPRQVVSCFSDEGGCLRAMLASRIILNMHGYNERSRILTCERELPNAAQNPSSPEH